MEPYLNYFKFPALALDTWCLMFTFMASTQLKIVGVVQSIEFQNVDWLDSCCAWALATMFMVKSNTFSIRSQTFMTSILLLFDFSVFGHGFASNMFTLSPLWDSPGIK